MVGVIILHTAANGRLATLLHYDDCNGLVDHLVGSDIDEFCDKRGLGPRRVMAEIAVTAPEQGGST